MWSGLLFIIQIVLCDFKEQNMIPTWKSLKLKDVALQLLIYTGAVTQSSV